MVAMDEQGREYKGRDSGGYPIPVLRCPEYVEVRPTSHTWRWRIDLHDGSLCYPRTRYPLGTKARAERIAKRMWAKHLARTAEAVRIDQARITIASS